MFKHFTLVVLLLAFTPLAFGDTQFRVMTYNALKFDVDDIDRQDSFGVVFSDIQPDIVLMQEIFTAAGADVLLEALNKDGDVFSRAEFIDGPDTDHMLFYRKSVVQLLAQKYIQTELRSFAEYSVRIDGNDLRLYSAHLKASQGSENEQKRFEEVQILRSYLNELEQNEEFIIVGDMNIYSSGERAYQEFIANQINNNGRAEDLISPNLVGDWHDALEFSITHTQSPRTTRFGGGAAGGICDRFDMILGSYGINDGQGIDFVVGSYDAYGNDGNRLNQSILDGVNTSVSPNVARALHDASDHLPVVADFVSYNTNSGYSELPYITSFETGLDPFWELNSSNNDALLEVSTDYVPATGEQHLIMASRISRNFTANMADLKLNLRNASGVTLNFAWKDFGDETHPEDGIYLSNNGGLSFDKVFDLNGADYPNNSWQKFVLQLDDLAAASGISYTDTMVLRFQQYDNWTINTDGFAFDDIEVIADNTYANLPYDTGFESGSVDGFWSLTTSNTDGLLAVANTNTPAAGDFHLLMASNIRSNYTTNQADLRVNLNGALNPELAFNWKDFGDEAHGADGVYFSNDGGVTFAKVFDLNGKNYRDNQWQIFRLDILSLAASVGMRLSEKFVIRFQQYDNWTIGVDGFALDSVSVYDGFVRQ